MTALLLLILAQAPGNSLPKFEDFKVTEVFKGKPAAPVLKTRRQREFRTMIRDGAKSGPNFAGRYTIAGWGCGSSCNGFAICDVVTGAVYDTPFEYLAWNGPPDAKRDGADAEPTSYRLDSRLLIVRACPEEKNCGTYYYEWTGAALKLIRKIAAPSH